MNHVPKFERINNERKQDLLKRSFVISTLTVLALSACTNNENDPSAERSVGSDKNIEQVDSGVCADVEANMHMLETDCNVLSPITSDARFKPLFEDTVDGMVVTRGEPVIGTIDDTSKLSDEYQKAFEIASNDPIVKMMSRNFPIIIEHVSGMYGYDGAYYDVDKNQVRFEFKIDQSDSELFKTWGSLRSITLHEGSHGFYDQWMESQKDDIITKDNIEQLGNIFAADAKLVVAEYFEKNDQIWEDALADMRELFIAKSKLKVFNSADAQGRIQKIIEAIDEYAQLREQNDDFINIHVYDKKTGEQATISPLGVIATLSSSGAIEEYFSGEEDYEILNNLDAPFNTHLRESFSFTTESMTLEGMAAENAGHPHDNVTELVASTITSAQMNPDGVIANIFKLPESRRKLQLEFLQTLNSQLNHANPGLQEQTNLAYVIQKLSD